MRADHGNPKLSGACNENLEYCIDLNETLAKMCTVTEDQKMAALPTILTVNSLIYLSVKMKGCRIYIYAILQFKR